MFSFSSTRFLVTLSFVVVGFLQQHPMIVQAADDEPAVVANTTTPVLDCVTNTKDIYTEDTITNAMDDAIAGVIDLQDPLSCTTGYVYTGCFDVYSLLLIFSHAYRFCCFWLLLLPIWYHSGDKLKCTYNYGKQESNFQEVCTSEATQGIILDRDFEIHCKNEGKMGGVTYTFLQAPLCIAAGCDAEGATYYNALTATTDAMASYMNNITGIKDCTADISAGMMTSQNGGWRVTFLGSAMFVAMTFFL